MISYLMFADNCIMFGEVAEREVTVMKNILKECEACLEQCINFEKSLLFSVLIAQTKLRILFPNLLGTDFLLIQRNIWDSLTW